MFEAPIFPVKEYSVDSARAALNGRFIFAEERSVVEKEERGAEDFMPGSRVTRRAKETRKRKRGPKEEEEEEDTGGGNDYRGLYTDGVYTPTGKLQSHILNKPFDPSGGYRPSSYPYDLYMNGLEPMPRPASPLKVVRDSPQTYASMNEFSPGVRRIVTKNNVPKDADTSIVTVNADDADDDWLRNSLRLRHTHIVSSIVHLSMLRADYALASRAFALLIRASNVDIRVTWTIGLELLVWRREMRQQQRQEHEDNDDGLPNNGDVHTQPSRLPRKEDDEFLEWLVVNYPHLAKRRPSKWKYRSRAPDFYPHLIMSKMRGGDPNDALDRLRELLLESPYSDTPLFYALAGIATIQLLTIEKHRNNTTKIHQLLKEAHAYFDKCIALGGIYPNDFIDFELLQFAQDNDE